MPLPDRLPPYCESSTVRYTCDNAVRVMLTATSQPVVQYFDGSIWRYDSVAFWLGRTPQQFADIQATYHALLGKTPAAPPTISAEDFL
jgi:hypothetical protein